jgi:hypothetical protein
MDTATPPAGRPPSSFVTRERAAQATFFAETLPADARIDGWAYRLRPEHRLLNLMPELRPLAGAFFEERKIVWHRHAAHGLSSQACCLNFLMPLARRPEVLSRVIGAALGIAPPAMLPVDEAPDGTRLFVGFEWTGSADYLTEWPTNGRASAAMTSSKCSAASWFAPTTSPPPPSSLPSPPRSPWPAPVRPCATGPSISAAATAS